MFKKRRIKKEFDLAIAQGDDARVEQLLRENPWLQEHVEVTGDDSELMIKRICAAIGIMEDELQQPAPLEEISYSLENDFNVSIDSTNLESMLLELETKHYIKSESGGYVLTVEGGRICDNYLNAVASNQFPGSSNE